MAKDMQRNKVYRAEDAWKRDSVDGQLTLSAAQEWLDILVAQFEVPVVRIQRNLRIKQWGGWYKRYGGNGPLIEVPAGAIKLSTVVHEFAHHLDDMRREAKTYNYRDPGHGGAYTEAMLDVVKAVYGPASAQRLEQAYHEGSCLVGAQAAQEKAQKAKERKEAMRQRDGERGDVYLVARGLETDATNAVWLEGSYLTYHVSSAKAYRTLAAAKRAGTKHWDAVTIYRSGGIYRTGWDGVGRWWQHRDAGNLLYAVAQFGIDGWEALA